MLRRFGFLTLGLAGLAFLVVAGCDSTRTPTLTPSPPEKSAETKGTGGEPDGEHAHKPGKFGGLIVEIGRDNYHAEAVFEKNGVVRVYTLGKDEAVVQEVEAQTLTAYGKAEGATEAAEFALKPVRRPGDAGGKTSQFVGVLPQELWGKRVEVTVPSIRIADARFRFGFTSVGDGHEEGMPPKVADEEERKLYLTPGGKYTEADIKANGSQTASQKFQGQMASHDLKPKAGDKICPITLTKANPKFSWVVGGKEYQFCCPPCVDEFVKQAKEQPDTVQEPQEYVKK
jgi:YHS domain-containing protein